CPAVKSPCAHAEAPLSPTASASTSTRALRTRTSPILAPLGCGDAGAVSWAFLMAAQRLIDRLWCPENTLGAACAGRGAPSPYSRASGCQDANVLGLRP